MRAVLSHLFVVIAAATLIAMPFLLQTALAAEKEGSDEKQIQRLNKNASAKQKHSSMPAVTKKEVEVVFVLDTTGSMDGLIKGAKRKIWFVANEILAAKQQPLLKIGLVAYRDRGDAYVTKTLPLSDDLDEVYTNLMALHTAGGGDFPEDVNAGLAKAVKDMRWTDGKDTLKMIFLVGDAPPHMDYNEVTHATLSTLAIRQNIYINTLQCGTNKQTTLAWQAIARNSEGRFAAIPQDGGVRVVTTPFDEELGRLARDLDTTFVDYGSVAKRNRKSHTRSSAGGLAMDAPATVRAERALAKSKAGPSKKEDLISLLETDGDDAIDKVSANQLSDEMQKMNKTDRKKHLKKLSKKRKSIQSKIAKLEKKRGSFIATEEKEHEKKGGKRSGFDKEVVAAIRTQAKTNGLSWD